MPCSGNMKEGGFEVVFLTGVVTACWRFPDVVWGKEVPCA